MAALATVTRSSETDLVERARRDDGPAFGTLRGEMPRTVAWPGTPGSLTSGVRVHLRRRDDTPVVLPR
jgi:hypothetical protein